MKRERYTGAHCTRIENVRGVWEKIRGEGNAALSLTSFQRLLVLTTDHRKTLPHVWGKPHQHYLGEFRFHVWRLEHDQNVYWVFTSLKGTSVEWDTRGDPARVPAFVDWLYDQLHEALRLAAPEELDRIMTWAA
jgi:hypothetical protein